MSQQWYYSKDGVHEGPVDREEIIRLIENGVLTPAVLVCQKGGMNWEPIHDVPNFQQTEIYPGGKPHPNGGGSVPSPAARQAVGGEVMSGGGDPASAAVEDRMPRSLPVASDAGGVRGGSFFSRWPKPVFFGVVGALGCLVGALIGQLYLLLFPSIPPALPPTVAKSNIALLIDTSGSMSSGPLEEVKRAAVDFVDRQRTDSGVKIAIVHFDSEAAIDQPLTTDTAAMIRAINGLVSTGGTALDRGLDRAGNALLPPSVSPHNPRKDFVLVFTDGQPNDEGSAMAVASQLRERSVNILVVHTAGAPYSFLVSLTGATNQVFSTSAGNFGLAFAEAEKIINTQLGIATTNIEGKPVLAFLSNGGWFAILAIALSFALVLAQNSTMMVVNEGKLFRWGQAMICCLIGLAAGLAAGVGNALFQQVSEDQAMSFVGGVFVWSILGGAIGFAMVFVILNFKPSRAVMGGLLGGLVGGLVFNLLRYLGSEQGDSGSALAEIAGRLIGAVLVGALVGCFIAVIEQISREAYLVVHWAPNETSTLNLGQQPVTIGGREDDVFINGVPDGALSIVLNEGRISCTQQPGNTQSQLKDQSTIDLGKVKIVVHART
jgi:Ca-activated chloride channel family protein